ILDTKADEHPGFTLPVVGPLSSSQAHLMRVSPTRPVPDELKEARHCIRELASDRQKAAVGGLVSSSHQAGALILKPGQGLRTTFEDGPGLLTCRPIRQ